MSPAAPSCHKAPFSLEYIPAQLPQQGIRRATPAMYRRIDNAACRPITPLFPNSGEVAEWLKAPVSKTGIPLRVSRVRIPLSPPEHFPGSVPRCPIKAVFLFEESSLPIVAQMAMAIRAGNLRRSIRGSSNSLKYSIKVARFSSPITPSASSSHLFFNTTYSITYNAIALRNTAACRCCGLG